MNGLWGERYPHTSFICHWLLSENSHLPPAAINSPRSPCTGHGASHSSGNPSLQPGSGGHAVFVEGVRKDYMGSVHSLFRKGRQQRSSCGGMVLSPPDMCYHPDSLRPDRLPRSPWWTANMGIIFPSWTPMIFIHLTSGNVADTLVADILYTLYFHR